MEAAFEYVFPAIGGIQAGREYYVSQCPLRLIPKIFLFDEDEVLPEIRAQRSLNRQRLPDIARYILDNRASYVFSAITASIDADVRFDSISAEGPESRIGTLHVPMSARFIVNDGQHRRGAIEMALAEDPALGDESIAIVFFLDLGLERCQQMFADLNRYAIRPSASIGVLYDHRDPQAAIARAVVQRSDLLHHVVDLERTNLAPKSRRLFTLSAVFTATKALLGAIDDTDDDEELIRLAVDFWEGIASAFPEWQQVKDRKVTAGEVRRDFISSHGTVLHSLGNVGSALIAQDRHDWSKAAEVIATIDWSRSNAKLWEGRAMIGGKVSKASHNVVLTTNVIKSALSLELSPEEQRVEDAFKRGEYRRA